MGEVLIPGGGSGADLSQVTAEPSDVLSPKVYLDSEGIQHTGTIQSKGAANYNTKSSDQSIATRQYINGAQTIKKVIISGVDASKMLSTMTLKVGDADDAARLLSQQGSIPVTTPGTVWPSSSDQDWTPGRYISGNITQKPVTTSGVAQANFKHNVTVRIGDAGNSSRLVNFKGSFDSDGTVTSGLHMRKDKIGYAKGTKYTGTLYPLNATNPTITNNGANSITLTCKAPTKQVGMPWGGIVVYGKIGSYPTSRSDSGAFAIGTMTTSTAGGVCTKTYSNATNLPVGKTVYVRGWNFYRYNTDGSSTYNNNIYGDYLNFGSTLIGNWGYQAFTTAGGSTWTVPANSNRIRIFLVGGGGGCKSCSAGDAYSYASGAGGGYTLTTPVIPVTGGTTRVTYQVGAGGSGDANGGNSIATVNGTTYTAEGGKKSNMTDSESSPARGANGGSGGGGSCGSGGGSLGGDGGYDGNAGNASTSGGGAGGSGQGSTTRAFGNTSYSALYFGPGGGGASLGNTQRKGGASNTTGYGCGAYNLQGQRVNGTSGTSGIGAGAGGTGVGASAGTHGALNGGAGRIVIYYYYVAS